MRLPFSIDDFLGVFAAYHQTWGPAQPALLVLACVCVYLANRPRPHSDALISTVLAVLWVWVGAVYHLGYFAAINPIATLFGVFSIAGGLVFAWLGVVRRALVFRAGRDALGFAGWALVLYALLGYPALTLLSGHRYPEMPTFGLPCPTTLFTIGLLAWSTPPRPRFAWVVPLLWCLVGLQAAVLLDMPADIALGVAAIVGLWEIADRPPSRRASTP